MTGAAIATLPPDALDTERARAYIERARSTDEVKGVRDKAIAVERYQREIGASREGRQGLSEIITRAEVRLGELLRESPKAEGARAGGEKDSPRGPILRPRDSVPTLASQGIDKRDASVWQRAADMEAETREEAIRKTREAGDVVTTAELAEIATAPIEVQREIVARGAAEILAAASRIRAERTEARRAERLEKIATIATGNAVLDASLGTFPVIYGDPPWRYEHAESESRAIENHYPTMELDAICALPVPTITTDDAILYLWVTSPKLEEGLRVVREWGFTYRTSIVWDKEKYGMGYYARIQHEILLIATKGNFPPPPPDARPRSVLRFDRGEHSAKPGEFAEMIERAYPGLPKLELFCRSPRPGWRAWGNQSGEAAA